MFLFQVCFDGVEPCYVFLSEVPYKEQGTTAFRRLTGQKTRNKARKKDIRYS